MSVYIHWKNAYFEIRPYQYDEIEYVPSAPRFTLMPHQEKKTQAFEYQRRRTIRT